uniref:C2H2-type domain-containing protein n=1 Tax=Gongylonema pulchrum TaxID=637853 RepID=A0A183EB63_9BILA
LTPSDWELDKVSNEDQLRGLLSEHFFLLFDIFKLLVVKTLFSSSSLPVFVQYGEKERQLYIGVCQNKCMRTSFESVHQRRGHPLKCHLSGYLDIFREDRPCNAVKTELTPEYGMAVAGDLDVVDVTHLPFGAATDAVEEFGLSAIWSNVDRGILVEEQHFTNLDPLQASSWSSCMRSLLETAESPESSCVVSTKLSPSALDSRRALSSLLMPVAPQNIAITKPDGDANEDNLKSAVLQRWIDAIFEKPKRSFVLSTKDSVDDVAVEPACSTGRTRSPGPGGAVKNTQPCKSAVAENSAREAGMSEDLVDFYQQFSRILPIVSIKPDG